MLLKIESLPETTGSICNFATPMLWRLPAVPATAHIAVPHLAIMLFLCHSSIANHSCCSEVMSALLRGALVLLRTYPSENKLLCLHCICRVLPPLMGERFCLCAAQMNATTAPPVLPQPARSAHKLFLLHNGNGAFLQHDAPIIALNNFPMLPQPARNTATLILKTAGGSGFPGVISLSIPPGNRVFIATTTEHRQHVLPPRIGGSGFPGLRKQAADGWAIGTPVFQSPFSEWPLRPPPFETKKHWN